MSQQHYLRDQNDSKRAETCSIPPSRVWFVYPRCSYQCCTPTIGLEQGVDLTAINMAYLNGNPQLQSLNSIIKFHLEVRWGALSKSGVINAEIYSHLASIHISETRYCHKSSKLMLALHIGLGVTQNLASFCHQDFFLYTSILRSLPWTRVLHHMNMYNGLRTNSQLTIHFVSASNVVCLWSCCRASHSGDYQPC